ncbi:hypothetical protein ES703_124581 [subsurface metagenome]
MLAGFVSGVAVVVGCFLADDLGLCDILSADGEVAAGRLRDSDAEEGVELGLDEVVIPGLVEVAEGVEACGEGGDAAHLVEAGEISVVNGVFGADDFVEEELDAIALADKEVLCPAGHCFRGFDAVCKLAVEELLWEVAGLGDAVGLDGVDERIQEGDDEEEEDDAENQK